MPSWTSPRVSCSGFPISRVMRSAISSFRRVRMSPTRRSTSPRAGAGVLLHSSKPHLADRTASATSASPDSGNRPMMSLLSAGFTFWKYSPVEGATHLPPMKFLKSVMFDLVRARDRPSFARPGCWMQGVGFRITHARQHFHRAEDHAPEHEQERQRVSARRAMAPRPHRTPDAAGGHHTDRRQITEETNPAARVVGPEDDAHAKRYREQQSEKDAKRARRPLLLQVLGSGRRGLGTLGRLALGREQRLVGDRLQLAIDLGHLFRPVAIGHCQDPPVAITPPSPALA